MKLLAEISARFANLPPNRVDDEIDRALQSVCTSFNIDESSIYQISTDPEVMVLTHIFRDPKLPPAPPGLNAATYFPWCLKKVLANQEICLSDTENAPPEAAVDVASWKLFNVRSAFVIPLATGGSRPFAAWGLDSTTAVCEWPEELQKRLRIIANFLAVALERKFAYQKQLEDEASLNLATQAVNIAFWTLNPATGAIWATPKSRELFGFDANENLTLEKYLRSVHPEDVSKVRATIETVLREGAGECEYRFNQPDGTTGWVLSRGGLSSSKADGVRLLSGIALDITNRRRVESVLRESEERFRRVVEHVSDALMADDIQGRVVFANERFLNLFRLRRDELANLTLEDYVAPEYRAELRDRHDKRMRGENVATHFEYEGIRRDHTRMWLEVDVVPTHDDDGTLTGTQSAIRDITVRKEMEEELRRRKSELEEAQRVARLGSWTRDRNDVLTWSDEMYRIHGRDPSLGPPSFEGLELLFTPESWQRLKATRDAAWQVKSVPSEDLEIIRPDGSRGWIATCGEVEFDPEDRIVRVRGTALDITARKLDEQKLREYQQTIENADEMIAVIDRDYRYVIANRSFLAVRGMAKDQVVGRYMWEVLPEQFFNETVKPQIARAFSGEVVRYELRFSYPELGERDMAVSYFPLEAPHGIERVLCILRDVTERRKQERALRASEERYRSLVESSHDWIWETDADGKYTYAGPQCLPILGYKPEEILGKRPFDLMPEAEASRVAEVFGTIAKERKPFRLLENVNKRKDGRLIVLETNGVPIFDEHGKYLGYRGMDRDVTERKKAEEALIESEQKFIKLFRTAPIAIGLSTLDGKLIDVNDAFEVITGYVREETIGRTALDLGLWVAPGDREYIRTMLLSEGRVRDLEHRFRTKAGEVRTGLLSSDLIDIEGTTYVLTAVKDVTEQKEAEQNLRELSRRLITAQEEERKRIARELHDNISQRLALLSFSIDQLAKGESSRALRTKLSKLLADTKFVSSDIQALSHQLHSASLDLLGLAAGIESFRRELAKRHDVTIEFVHQGVPKAISSDLSLALFRITQEALNNAVKYSGAKKVEVILMGEADELQLTIRDHGVGFDVAAATPRGLGLISMRERILPFAGTISINSKPKQGTEIRVWIPLNKHELQPQRASILRS